MPEFLLHKTESGWKNQKSYFKHLKDVPIGTYKVTIVSASKRTLQQNAWFHAILPEILQGLRDVGFDEIKTTEDAKDIVKALFFKKTVSNGSETFEVIEGTSKQTKINFAEKAEEIIKWASEYLGIDVAPPNEQLQFNVE